MNQFTTTLERKENNNEFKTDSDTVILQNGGRSLRIPLFANYIFSALAGTILYFQFFFYTMGETEMGKYQFSSWTLHMASIIICSSLWGIYLTEWNNTSSLTKFLLGLALFTLIASTLIVGYANLLGIKISGL